MEGGHKLPTTVCGCLFGQLADTHMGMQKTLTHRQPGIQKSLGIDTDCSHKCVNDATKQDLKVEQKKPMSSKSPDSVS